MKNLRPEFRIINPQFIQPCPYNPRHLNTNSASFQEFKNDVAAAGVRIPVAVRHDDGGVHYQLIYGERRWRAASLCGLTSIPTLFYGEITDEQARKLTATENLGREDLTPLEESRAVLLLLDASGDDARAVAAELGRSERWVELRRKLQDLTAVWKAGLDAVQGDESEEGADVTVPDPAGGRDLHVGWLRTWGIGHLEQIARLPAETQDAMIRSFSQRGGIAGIRCAGLERVIASDWMHMLAAAPWKRDDEMVLPDVGSCTRCAKRSTAQGVLFHEPDEDEDTRKNNDRCLDVECWNRKRAAYLKQRYAEVKEMHPKLVCVEGNDSTYQEERWIEENSGLKLENCWDYDSCKKTDNGAIPVVIGSGAQLGKLKWMRKGGSQGNSPGKKRKTLKEKRDELESKRWAWVIDHVRGVLEKTGYDDIPADSERHREYITVVLVGCLGVGPTLRVKDLDHPWERDDLWETFDSLFPFEDGSQALYRRLWPGVRKELMSKLHYYQKTDVNKESREDVRRACDLFGLDCGALFVQACEEVPEPKSWANTKPAEKTGKKTTKKAAKKNTKKATKKSTKRGKKKGGV